MRRQLGLGAWVVVALAVAGGARAQVPPAEQACITGFNKRVRDVGKAQSKNVAKCLQRFASGSLTTTVEACLLGDVSGRLVRKSSIAIGKVGSMCAGGTPAFGVSAVDSALGRVAGGEIDLLHSAIGRNLDTDLVPVARTASCQSRVAGTLLKCLDARWKVFLKCQRFGLTTGFVTDAASLESRCLPSGVDPFDPGGRLAKVCDGKLSRTLGQRCVGEDLATAFPAIGTSNAGELIDAMVDRSRCTLCQTANDVDGLSRDCDAYDDGDTGNGSCGAECADGVVQVEEGCDDGGVANGDGCSSICRVEDGWACSGSPSVCTPSCGNGRLDPGEGCDDGGTTDGNGCASDCQIEPKYSCTGEPSVCTLNCGNGVLETDEGEVCDDGDRTSGDGCSSDCRLEDGWSCTGQPSACTFVCGNGSFQAGETCDDQNANSGDGCSHICQVEPGWLCSGQPSLCTPLCGDGLVRGGEDCDDGNPTSGDGCSFTCLIEPGFTCTGDPSNCQPICGDGFVRGLETCDDDNTVSNDGCSGNFCRQEPGWTCLGQPSVCTRNCGNGHLDPQEECDDGDRSGGDGCGATCRVETGYACGGEPSVCVPTCGNGVLNSGETCDDGNTISGDGCNAGCRNEPAWYCPGPGLSCQPFEIFIDGPAHGTFTTASSTTVTGHYTVLPAGVTSIMVNGVPASSVNTSARTFSHTVGLSAPAVLNAIKVTLTNTANGNTASDRVVVVDGPSVADGAISPRSAAVRMNDSGLDSIEPLINQLAGGLFDIGSMIPAGTEVMPWQCYFNFIWCWAGASARIGSPSPSVGRIRFNADSTPGAVNATIKVDNLRIDIDIDGTGIVPDCGLRMLADQLEIRGDYQLSPDPANPAKVDVTLTNLTSTFHGFRHEFTHGSCGLISAAIGDVQSIANDSIGGFIDDPDGAGPAESPIADAIEEALGGISIAGGVGTGVGLNLYAPMFDIAEDATGITLGADTRFTKSIGSGPGQCIPPPGAPDFAASYAPVEAFPSFGAVTPTTGKPYGIGVSISTAGFNQLLRGQTECGLLRTSLTEIDLDGPGGIAPLPVTAGLLALLAPEFGQLPASTPISIEVTPTLAPLITGNAGPNGELMELKVAQVAIDMVGPGGVVYLGGAFDARLGLNLDFLPDGSGLSVAITPPTEADTSLVILYNPLGTNAASLEASLPALVRPMIPQLASSLSGFSLPEFFGLSLQGVEVSHSGKFISLFANLAPGS